MALGSVTARDFPPIRWRGHWVWVPEEPIVPGGFLPGGAAAPLAESHGLFRRSFDLTDVPARAPARVTADSRYALFVNGRRVSRGPIRSQPHRLHYDLLDLAPYLRAGRNVLALHVVYYGTPKAYWMPATPNMTLGKSGILVFEADLGAAGWLVSDGSWRARKAEAWSAEGQDSAHGMVGGGTAIEVFDARLLPSGWQEPAFDDGAWGAAQLVPALHIGSFARSQPPTDPYGPLYANPLAPLGGATRTPAALTVETLHGPVDLTLASPVTRVEAALGLPVAEAARPAQLPLSVVVPAGGAARVVVDMGRIVAGFVQFAVEASAGTVLDLSYVEEPITGPSGPIAQHAGTRYVARGADDRFAVFDPNGLRYAYLLVHGTAGPVTLTQFAIEEHLYPWQEGAAFACADEELNRIFAAGLRTVALNSHDAFIDCPTREQRAWVGDAVVHQMVHLATNPDWRLAWHYLTLGNSPRPDGILPMSVVGEIEASGGLTIPDWSLHWLHAVHNRYLFDGDREAIAALLPTAERILRWYAPYQTADGVLKDVVEWNLVDWSSVSTGDTSAVLTALWARGLREFAAMAGWLEQRASQLWAEALYERARAGFEAFWDAERGSYVDHIVDGVPRREISQLAGALAICSGLTPTDRWARIVDTITDEQRLVVRGWLMPANDVSKAQKHFQGIYEIDWDAEQQIVRAMPFMSYTVHDAVALAGRAERLPELYRRWSGFLTGGYDTLGENWGYGTHVHGWSCTPTRDMIFYTLRVTPAQPGYASARIAPRLGPLAWARGAVPTPHGLIEVEASPATLRISSPVPVVVDLAGRPPRTLPAGQHEIPLAPAQG